MDGWKINFLFGAIWAYFQGFLRRQFQGVYQFLETEDINIINFPTPGSTKNWSLMVSEGGWIIYCGGFKYVLFSQKKWGKMNSFWRAYFSTGWLNHQLDYHSETEDIK